MRERRGTYRWGLMKGRKVRCVNTSIMRPDSHMPTRGLTPGLRTAPHQPVLDTGRCAASKPSTARYTSAWCQACFAADPFWFLSFFFSFFNDLPRLVRLGTGT